MAIFKMRNLWDACGCPLVRVPAVRLSAFRLPLCLSVPPAVCQDIKTPLSTRMRRLVPLEPLLRPHLQCVVCVYWFIRKFQWTSFNTRHTERWSRCCQHACCAFFSPPVFLLLLFVGRCSEKKKYGIELLVKGVGGNEWGGRKKVTSAIF